MMAVITESRSSQASGGLCDRERDMMVQLQRSCKSFSVLNETGRGSRTVSR